MRSLFTPLELFDGFDQAESGSYERTLDFQTYVKTKGPSRAQRLSWAEQDQEITEARDAFLLNQRCVAVMGGHKAQRDEVMYREVVLLARRLTRHGLLVASGGGPGAMEATHLGACVASRNDDQLERALTILQRCTVFPSGMTRIVDELGHIDRTLLESLHQWQSPAFDVLEMLAADGPIDQSLAIPTWFYGHEPPTPFATHIAKYLSNALREDGLLAVASHGVIYAPGNAGTLQEIFQDSAQNAYLTYEWFSPMVFLDLPFHDVDRWWTKQFPIESMLRPLFGDANYQSNVLITPDPEEAFEFIAAFAERH